MDDKTIKNVRAELKLHAKALNIPPGAARTFIDRAIESAQKSLAYKPVITSADLTRAIVHELKKYNQDFAYVYQKRDTII